MLYGNFFGEEEGQEIQDPKAYIQRIHPFTNSHLMSNRDLKIRSGRQKWPDSISFRSQDQTTRPIPQRVPNHGFMYIISIRLHPLGDRWYSRIELPSVAFTHVHEPYGVGVFIDGEQFCCTGGGFLGDSGEGGTGGDR